MNEFSVAVLMPTCGRPEVVKDTLSACLDLYKNYDFDVYIFDSNSNNETQNIVKNLQEKYDNLFYIRQCEFIHLDCKWLDMIRGKYLKKDYKYIYPCGDANSLTDYSLNIIYPFLQSEVDIINLCDIKRINKTTEFNTPNDFFNSPNRNTGQWGGAIYNYKRIFNLTDEEWNEAVSKWFNKNLEYLGLNGFIYERISLCNNLKIIEPSMNGAEPYKVLRRSIYKKGSFWRKDAIQLIATTYPKVYRMLPECYTNIDEQIKKLIYDNFNEDYFLYLKQNHCFCIKDFYKFKKVFDKENVKILNYRIFLLSILPENLFFYNLIKKISRWFRLMHTIFMIYK